MPDTDTAPPTTLPPSSIAVRDGAFIDHMVVTCRDGGPSAIATALALAGYIADRTSEDRMAAVHQRLRDTGVMTPGGAIR